MAGVRRALIVATDRYTDPKLTSLNAPANDARALADVLRDEAVGCFDVQTVLNRPSHEVELAIAEFFGTGKYGDTLLAHFSCHGVKSPSGELYFATMNTDLSDTFKLKVTGVPSALVRDAMEESRASLILCLVDCCYSGAFVKLAKAADTVDLTERLGGKGRAVITASTSLQLALDGEEQPSLFTHAVIEGLRSGDADRDLDGLVSLDELYSFVHEQVTSANPNQTPVKSFDVQGEVYVARRSRPVTRPAQLDSELLSDVRALVTYKRLGAVGGLANILAEGHPGRSFAARLELARMAASDDSLSVRGEAQRVLDAAGEVQAPAIPDYEPTVVTRGGPALVVSAPDAPTTEERSTDAETTDAETTDAETIENHHGGGAPRRWRQSFGRKRTGVIALCLVGLLAIGGLAWRALHNGPVLPDTELLVPEINRGIIALDVRTLEDHVVVADPTASFPTISEDRQWMVYLTSTSKPDLLVPQLARVDGSDSRPLIDDKDSCPFTRRIAFSPDGERLATTCLNESGGTMGVAILDRDGNLIRPLIDYTDVEGAPTWAGDGRIVIARDPEGDDIARLWAVSPEGTETDGKWITNGKGGSDVHPDWSEHGLLFLRIRDDGRRAVMYKETLDTSGVTTIAEDRTAGSPTWAPEDEEAAVWLEPATEGTGTMLRVGSRNGESLRDLVTGDYGPPAWGSR